MLEPQEIKRMRLRMKLSQVALARLLCVSRRAVQRWETLYGQRWHRPINVDNELALRKLHDQLFTGASR